MRDALRVIDVRLRVPGKRERKRLLRLDEKYVPLAPAANPVEHQNCNKR